MSQADAGGKSPDERTLGELVAAAERDIAHLVRSEIDLAKMELGADFKRGGVSGGLLGGAGFLVYVAVLFFSVAAALALGLVIPLALGFLVVGAVYLLLATGLGLTGLSNLKKLTRAELTRKSLQDILSLFKRPASTQPRPAPAHASTVERHGETQWMHGRT